MVWACDEKRRELYRGDGVGTKGDGEGSEFRVL